MAFELSSVVPWGRSYAEYVAMFALSDEDLKGRILGCGDGPAAFNAGLTGRGGSVVSVDPLYAFSAGDIRRRIAETTPLIMEQTRRNVHEFVWEQIRSIDELAAIRSSAMEAFLADYPAGIEEGRYVAESAPRLSFPDGSFGLALVSHLLFLYSDHLDLRFHIDTITELCRVCGEVRVFPLLKMGATMSPHVEPVMDHFSRVGYEVGTVRVAYEYQRGGNQMLRVRVR
ncbi:MAG: hypothetical protein JW706_03115 [Opitutales bacterium]|nr:hypothetical protein [Opitutales bacterium]